jgi:hypothetical protein
MRAEYQLHLLGRATARPIDALGLHLGVDTGLLGFGSEGATADGRPFDEQAKRTFFLGETYADLQLGETGVLELRAGKLRPRIARGAIFDAYAFGVTADLDYGLEDPDLPWSARAHALLPDASFTSDGKNSPLFDLELAFAFGEASEVRAFGALFVDGENGLSPVLTDGLFRGILRQALADAQMIQDPIARRMRERRIAAFSGAYNSGLIQFQLQTSGIAAWTGLTTKLAFEDVTVKSTLALGLGEVDVFVPATELFPERNVDIKLRSFFGDVEAIWTVSALFELDAFAIAVSGDSGFARGDTTYGSFIALAPLVTYTPIFFSGGVAANLASPVVASVAPDGAGLISAGVGLGLTPLDIVHLRVGLAFMRATVESPATRAKDYGFELDVALDAEVTDFLVLSGSGALFEPGSYFGELRSGYQVIAAATVLLP